jgi:hypothetical protein
VDTGGGIIFHMTKDKIKAALDQDEKRRRR